VRPYASKHVEFEQQFEGEARYQQMTKKKGGERGQKKKIKNEASYTSIKVSYLALPYTILLHF
jgi:hypothetical protein